MDFLNNEDVRELRLTCSRWYELTRQIMQRSTLYLNYCQFPTDLETYFKDTCLPTTLRFGEEVRFETGNTEFLQIFCSRIKSVSFSQCKRLNDEKLLYFLPFFTDLEELEIKAHFLSVDEIFGRNIQLVRTDNRVALSRTFANLKRFSTECCYVSPQQFNDLVALMPQLTAIKVSYISTFESCLTPKVLADFVRQRELQLKYLECGDSASDGLDNAFFFELATLTDLQLKKFSFSMKTVTTDSVIQFLNTQPNLEELEIYHSWRLSVDLVEYFGKNLTNLRVLNLRNGVPRLRGLAFLKNLKKLEELHLIDNRDVMSTFKFDPDFHVTHGLDTQFPKLKKLSLCNMLKPICNDCWEKLTKFFPNVTHLNLYGNLLGYKALQLIFKNLYKLQSLQMDRCPSIRVIDFIQVTVGAFTRLGISNLKGLRHLSIKRCPSLDQYLFHHLALPNLQYLNASEIRFGEESAKELVALCPQIRKLILNECLDIDTNTLKILCSGLPMLRYLDVSRTSRKLDWSIVWENCKSLQILVAESCSMDCREINMLFKDVPSLVYLKCSTLGIRRFEHKSVEAYEDYE